MKPAQPGALFSDCANRCGGIADSPGGKCDPCALRESAVCCIHNSGARGLAARITEWDSWIAGHGNFGASSRSHAWQPGLSVHTEPTARCQPTVIHADLRRWRDDDQKPWPCGCPVREFLSYRGACTGCDWEGKTRDRENAAVEDACDHAHPGWRDLPAVPRMPDERKALARWEQQVSAVYPPGWLEAGGPIRTLRQAMGTRHNSMHATPYGGYDLAVLEGGDAG